MLRRPDLSSPAEAGFAKAGGPSRSMERGKSSCFVLDNRGLSCFSLRFFREPAMAVMPALRDPTLRPRRKASRRSRRRFSKVAGGVARNDDK